ncbi:hypothetical protein CEE44_04210 [Candidatus Woesearchaeota archaeon B3_Woes]|nr:MAG: hypothetical protein CEE44_04210 [Candidatus Woesearchaeota archaeon B3_Woes]
MIIIKKSTIILFIITLLVLIGCDNQEIPQELRCTTNAECVPSSCCHSTSCINEKFKQDCNGIRCTMECAPGTMDCGQGSCACQNNKCEAVIN